MKWLVFVNLVQSRVTWEGGAPQLRNYLHKIGLWKLVFLVNDGCGRTQPAMGSAIPGQVVLGCMKKQAEQATQSKAVTSIPLCSLLQFLASVSALAFLDVTTYNL